jgi:regulator of protease activity HflC (stomatin/prohibitin superfamily)
MMATACTTVKPGTVGIEVNNYGAGRGVQDYPIRTGRVIYNPITTDVYVFPTSQQRAQWSKSSEEGGANTSVECRSKEGTQVALDIAVAYQFTADKVPALFVKFRQSADEITSSYVRDQVRKSLCSVTEKMPILDILGPRLTEVGDSAKNLVNTDTAAYGITFDYVNIIGKPHVASSVEQAINNVIQQVQAANQAEAKTRQITAEAAQAIERAKGEAQSIELTALAQAKANEIIAKSLEQFGDKVLQSKAIEKWNGVLPTVTSTGAVPFIPVK